MQKINDGVISESALRGWLASPLDQCLQSLSDIDSLDDIPYQHGWFEQVLIEKVRGEARQAFDARDDQALTDVHSALFFLYELHTCMPDDRGAANQHSGLLNRARAILETAWLGAERKAMGSDQPLDRERVAEIVETMWHKHSASAHPLFDFLEKEASLAQMKRFFLSDSSLNLRFFDLLAFSLVGSSEDSRAELVQNLWDESGKGDRSQTHVRMFRDLLGECDIGKSHAAQRAALKWEGLEGYNLFMMTAVNRSHYFKSLGVMAITELMDPTQYEKVVRGCRRLGFSEDQIRYYSEHITIDVVHGRGWLDNVIAPTTLRHESAASDVILGAYLRLKSCQHYYDNLLIQIQDEELAVLA